MSNLSDKMASVLITRYNIRANFIGSDKSSLNLDNKWLAHRRDLFNRYCLPSVRHQSLTNFTWFVMFDPDTPAEYYDYLDGVITPVFARSQQEAHDKINTSLESFEYCVSTRLDNDDALEKSHLFRAREIAFAGINSSMSMPHVINFRSGADYDVIKRKLFLRDYPTSNFFSLVSDRSGGEKLRFATEFHHVNVFKELDNFNIKTLDPMWLIAIHDQNVGNTVHGTKEVGTDMLQSLFGIEA
ncbi:glycosyltransferase [Sphingomonas sp. Leaf34]|uniref:glycosyltransferase n=1 Tax=Sphingomonas sp. Leaf34 TaxID=1736216 RepID=UPI0009E80C8E|nr:glycosyltransferase [Sphingomonas sp. Leaf34]